MKKSYYLIIVVIFFICLTLILYFNLFKKEKNDMNLENNNVQIYENNIPYKKISFEEMKSLIKNENLQKYVVLDVRTEEEFLNKRLPYSILIPDYEIEKAKDILLDKNEYIFVYCRSGNRSKKAVLKLNEMGYTNVYDLGGIINYPFNDTVSGK